MERLETKISTEEPGRLVVSLIGELDLGAADGLWSSLEPLLTEQGLMIVLDGDRLEFLDSSGLRVLARAANRAKETGITLRLVAPNPAVRRTLELAGAEELIQLFPTVAQALA